MGISFGVAGRPYRWLRDYIEGRREIQKEAFG